MGFGRITTVRALAGVAAIAVLVVGVFAAWNDGVFGRAQILPDAARAAEAPAPPTSNPNALGGRAGAEPILELNEKQLDLVKIAPVGEQVFPIQQEAVGSIDFDEDLSVQVFTPYQGKIISAFAQVGDEVKQGQPLFTIDSPDLLQAESTLIATAGVYDLTTKALARVQKLYATAGTGGIAEKDVQQATSDQMTAEGALKAARAALRVFGKTEDEINTMVAQRRLDSVLVVKTPITGKVTARNAQPGLLVQPGNAPAPYSVADISTLWMVANVPEIDTSPLKLGQAVKVSVMAYPGRVFEGKITTLGATVDPNLHALLVRSEIQDPRHELRPGMLANFVIFTADPVSSTAVPVDGVVREGDGTMTVWITTDHHHFAQRVVKIGLTHGGYDQILDGLKQGELVVTEGAVFLDNMLTPETTD